MNGRKRVLVTGGTGYIGASLVQKLLLNSNIHLGLLVRDTSKAIKMFGDTPIYIKIGDTTQIQKSFENFQPQIVIHLAAHSTSSDTQDDIAKLIESNIIFTSNLLLALSNIPLELFINSASFSEYHDNSNCMSPTYFYSVTKSSARLMIEYYAKCNQFNFINIVLYSVYGKKSKMKKIVDYALDSLDAKDSVPMSTGKQKLDFVHVDDIVKLYCKLISNSSKIKNSQIDYHIGSGVAYSIREMVSLLEELTEKKANISWGVYKSRVVDTNVAVADIALAQKELGYEVEYPLRDGLKRYLKDVAYV